MEMGKIRIVLIILTIVCHRLYIGIVLAKRRVCGKLFGETELVGGAEAENVSVLEVGIYI